MSRTTRRQVVRALVKSVINSKAKDIKVNLQSNDIKYFTKQIKQHGGK